MSEAQLHEEQAREFFGELIGHQLSAVTFVMDYVQLWFDGPGISVYIPLTSQQVSSGAPSVSQDFETHCAHR